MTGVWTVPRWVSPGRLALGPRTSSPSSCGRPAIRGSGSVMALSDAQRSGPALGVSSCGTRSSFGLRDTRRPLVSHRRSPDQLARRDRTVIPVQGDQKPLREVEAGRTVGRVDRAPTPQTLVAMRRSGRAAPP